MCFKSITFDVCGNMGKSSESLGYKGTSVKAIKINIFIVGKFNQNLELHGISWTVIMFLEYAKTLPKFTSSEMPGKVTLQVFESMGIKAIKRCVC